MKREKSPNEDNVVSIRHTCTLYLSYSATEIILRGKINLPLRKKSQDVLITFNTKRENLSPSLICTQLKRKKLNVTQAQHYE